MILSKFVSSSGGRVTLTRVIFDIYDHSLVLSVGIKAFMLMSVTFVQKSITRSTDMGRKIYLSTVDIALVSIFCAQWAILNLTLGRISFALTGLPILHDFSVFFTLLLIVWATEKFGTALLVGILGSAIVLLFGGPLPNIGFAASAVLFDVLMSINHHKLRAGTSNIALAMLVTMISAYFAGVTIGIFLINEPMNWSTSYSALTFWGTWHLIGGIISAIITLPIIGILEKASVGKIRSGRL